MLNGRDKYKSREIRTKISQVLVDTWDPIGVRDLELGADGEYEAYVGPVYTMLMNDNASAQEIAGWLHRIAIEHMGLAPYPQLEASSAKAAAELVALRPFFQLH